ncbi:hypothetical protein ACTSKR_13665 [Chitinibacteraceae bacterium HSL-7]
MATAWLVSSVPLLVTTSFASTVAYIVMARTLYGHVESHYNDMIPQQFVHSLAGDDNAAAFMRRLGEWRRSGEYKRVQEPWWQTLFLASAIVGWTAFLSMCALISVMLF